MTAEVASNETPSTSVIAQTKSESKDATQANGGKENNTDNGRKPRNRQLSGGANKINKNSHSKSNKNSINRSKAQNDNCVDDDTAVNPRESTDVVVVPKDENLPTNLSQDPRGDDPTKRIAKRKNGKNNGKSISGGRNTESFDPQSTIVRPALRVLVGSNQSPCYTRPLKHDDVVIVPELFGLEDDWSLYYTLVEEMTQLQQQNVKGSEWIAWHEGAHLIAKDPTGSKTFNRIIDRLCDYFNISKSSIGTRFNWYKDSSDWKPFHHDSAAFNPQRAKTQNVTVGVSFGSTRELAFLRATTPTAPRQQPLGGHDNQQEDCRIYFPQTNNGVFTFGRDVNIHWKHGINAMPVNEQDGKGRISIILWGLAQNVVQEDGSPPLLGSDGRGPHAVSRNKNFRNHKRNGGKRNNYGGNPGRLGMKN